MIQFQWGAISMGCLVISLFFLRFWRETRDKFFLFFCLAFALMAAERTILSILNLTSELRTWLFLMRLAAFALILVAIVQKNISQKQIY